MNSQLRRIECFDIAKGIGMILVVWVHAGGPLSEVIKTFHMPLLFFISGLLYSEKNVKEFLTSKLQALYIPFVVWNVITLSCLLIVRIIDLRTWIIRITGVVLTVYNEGLFMGATWFLAALFQISVLYRLIWAISWKVNKQFVILPVFALLSVIGYYYNLPGFIDSTLKFSVFYAIGVCTKGLFLNLNSVENKIIKVIAFFLVLAVVLHITVYFSRLYIMSYVLFITLGVLGSIATVFISHILAKILKLHRLLEAIKTSLVCIGVNSKDVLIWHFAAFKIVIIIQLVLQRREITLRNILAYYPFYDSSQGWWVTYMIVGISIPLVIFSIVKNTSFGKTLSRNSFLKHLL